MLIPYACSRDYAMRNVVQEFRAIYREEYNPLVHPIVSLLLEKRGITTDEVAAFLAPDYDVHTHAPQLLQGMDVAVERLLRAIESRERIAVYADFDCDGLPGAALLSDFLRRIGYENFEVYIPHRDLEGYGFHTAAIEKLKDGGVSLIVTVDVGTVAHVGLAFAKEQGVDVIVTDHHEPSEVMPESVALINPKFAPYPFPHLCGAACAFKLVQATLSAGRERGVPGFAVPVGWEKWLLDLVAIATVADMVPLIGENRALAHWGLTVLRRSQRPGIRALCSRLRIKMAELTEDDIGFSLAPRINAASRMGSPMTALTLLTTKDADEAERCAAELEDLNAKRKGVVAGIVREAKRKIKDRFSTDERVVVLGDPDWKPALLGLAANSIVGERGGLVCMWGRDGVGAIKGSCRSDGSLSVVDVFAEAREALLESGGHHASGGFTVSSELVHRLPEVFKDAATRVARKDIVAQVEHDALISLTEVSSALYIELSRLSPFGIGNPKPIFCIAETRITAIRRFGKEKNHIELELECARTGKRARAYDFFRSESDFSAPLSTGVAARVLASIERDNYRGGYALRLVDVLA